MGIFDRRSLPKGRNARVDKEVIVPIQYNTFAKS